MNKSKLSTFLAYIITASICLLIAFGVACIRGLFSASDTAGVLFTICDGFFVSSLLGICFGLMAWISSEGFFDIIAYGMKNILRLFSPLNVGTKGKFYDYKVEKEEKRKNKKPPFFILITGAASLVISVILYFVWSNISA